MNHIVTRCGVCAYPMASNLRICDACDTPTHADCFDYYGGCPIFGCNRFIQSKVKRERGTGPVVFIGEQSRYAQKNVVGILFIIVGLLCPLAIESIGHDLGILPNIIPIALAVLGCIICLYADHE